jgi:hypothetical protein
MPDQDYNYAHHQFRKFSFGASPSIRSDSVLDIAPNNSDDFHNLTAQLSLATLDHERFHHSYTSTQHYKSPVCLSPVEDAHPSSRMPSRRPSATDQFLRRASSIRYSRQQGTRLQSHYSHVRDIEALVDQMFNAEKSHQSPTSASPSGQSSPTWSNDQDLSSYDSEADQKQRLFLGDRRPVEAVEKTWVQKPIRARRKLVGQRKASGAGKRS